jgi:hypothetical protein
VSCLKGAAPRNRTGCPGSRIDKGYLQEEVIQDLVEENCFNNLIWGDFHEYNHFKYAAPGNYVSNQDY